jgi:hypothetical protein
MYANCRLDRSNGGQIGIYPVDEVMHAGPRFLRIRMYDGNQFKACADQYVFIEGP